ncbi:hypothetical protein C0989_012035 [Termitomyces sp. Mn162]|nr:hypothetical protein C0989_012035 [Termitomyces sp. Mn162]
MTRHGLSTGGIVGLVIGSLILAGLLAMMILKRRERIRHKRKLPKGTTLLATDNPTSAGSAFLNSIGNGRSGSEMTESPRNPGFIHSGADRILAENLHENTGSGHPTPQSYKPSNSAVAVSTHSNHLHPGPFDDSSYSSFLSHEQGFEPHQSDGSAGPSIPNRQPQSSSVLSPSTMHADLVAFQKDLERHHEKHNLPSGNEDTEASDPPPIYSD